MQRDFMKGNPTWQRICTQYLKKCHLIPTYSKEFNIRLFYALSCVSDLLTRQTMAIYVFTE